MRSKKNFWSLVLTTAFAISLIGAKPVQAEDAPLKTNSRGPQALLEKFKSAVYSQRVTDEQKAKLDPLFESAQTDLKAAEGASDKKEQAAKSKKIFDTLRADVSAVLTNEQKVQVAKAMAPPGPGAVIDRIKEQLYKPELKLTDDQRTKADQVLDDTKAKLEALMAEVKAGGKDAAKAAGPKAKEILDEMHKKLAEILPPDKLNGGQPAK